MQTIMVTGFGPFPGAPFNPTPDLVRHIARRRWPGCRVVTHLFRTSYAAIDGELPMLLELYKPDALLMFGLHSRANTLRIETVARNALAGNRDVEGTVPAAGAIRIGRPPRLPMPHPARRLLIAARRSGVAAALSDNAGGYLCNYLCWRAAEAALTADGPRQTVFVHVPPVRRGAQPLGRRPGKAFTPAMLARGGAALLTALAGCLGSVRKHP